MFRFAHIEILWLLTLIPLFVVAFILYTRRKRNQLKAFGDPALIAELMPDASAKRPVIKFSILMVALALLIIAATRPQYGQKSETIHRQGIEAMIALDISNSMLAEDVAPCRLDRAKQMLSKLIDQMTDDKVGLVVFAGESYVQLPITCDYVSAKMFINSITPELIQTQGTAIGSAIQTCLRSFGEPNEAGRCIILITDGENHEDDAEAAAKQAQEAGVQIFVVGIGKTEGSPIPVPGTSDYKKDREGNVVVSRLNEEMCQNIAKAGRGMYVHCDNTNTAMRALQKEIEHIASAEIDTEVYSDYNEQYQTFALLALLLLIIDFFIFGRQNHVLAKLDIFKEKKA
ncbi:MAG: VWA domain-containing protein [Paludibacteraceae bacterium]|nr:VWA domain-containing protein [Paludibacteraceae bacterium]